MKPEEGTGHLLRYRRLGIDSRNEHLVLMRHDCPVCRSEGFEALNRIRVSHNGVGIVASLLVMNEANGLNPGEAGLSEGAAKFLGVSDGEILSFSHLGSLDSMGDVRRKIYGHELDQPAYDRIISDIVDLDLSNVQLSAFITACAGDRMTLNEIVALTRSMIDSGQKIDWGPDPVFDKHSIGGLPGNRTTPIVVAIVAAAGLKIPKTSSRAITSPAGTADTMETLTNVELGIAEIRKVVEQEGGCLAWGGAVQLSPADDILIRVERALDLDSEGQLIASVLSKKSAAGSKAVVVDIPVGTTAKVRSMDEAERLASRMRGVGYEIGLEVNPVISDGSQPVGRGIGPALEALDVLAVLQCRSNAPEDLRKRAVTLAGKLLEMSETIKSGTGEILASQILASGKAWEKFIRICEAQGGLNTPPVAEYVKEICAPKSGRVTAIDNRKIARLAKLAGAPTSPAAGILLKVTLGDEVAAGDAVFELHSQSNGELEYAMDYLSDNADLVQIGDDDGN